MKKVLLTLMALVFCASMPIMAGNIDISAMKVDANDQAVTALLWMVYSDLQMCRTSLAQSMMDNVSAIGHLNNAQSALKKANLDPAYISLIGEIHKRVSKIKFYLVMNDRRAVNERLQQLMVIIRNVLGANSGNLPNYNYPNNGGYNNNSFGTPNGSGYVPPKTNPEVPVVGSYGSQSPSMPTLPSGVVPVR